MHRLRHPYSFATYEADDEGRIRVTAKDGRQGLFTRNGIWLEGELRAPVCPELCRWVSSYYEQKVRGNLHASKDRSSAFKGRASEKL